MIKVIVVPKIEKRRHKRDESRVDSTDVGEHINQVISVPLNNFSIKIHLDLETNHKFLILFKWLWHFAIKPEYTAVLQLSQFI